jgi:hypothetical protein
MYELQQLEAQGGGEGGREDRKLQWVLNAGANAVVQGARNYGREAACPTEEERQHYLEMKQQAAELLPGHARRTLMGQGGREGGKEGGREAGLAFMHRNARAEYQQGVIEGMGRRTVPMPVGGAEVVARQEEFKASRNPAVLSAKDAGWLQEMEEEGRRRRGERRGEKDLDWDDMDDYDGVVEKEEEEEEGDPGPF